MTGKIFNLQMPLATESVGTHRQAEGHEVVSTIKSRWKAGERQLATMAAIVGKWMLLRQPPIVLGPAHEEHCRSAQSEEPNECDTYAGQYPTLKGSLRMFIEVRQQSALDEESAGTSGAPWWEKGKESRQFRLESLIGQGTFRGVSPARKLFLGNRRVVKVAPQAGTGADVLGRTKIVPIYSLDEGSETGPATFSMPNVGRGLPYSDKKSSNVGSRPLCLPDRAAFTLIELLVVVSIVAVLLSLLLPAVQAAREAARLAQCGNNVKQLSLAAVAHESSLKFFPTGGWDDSWLGHPDRGFGARQPGGWLYSILPFLEQQALHDLGAAGTGTTVAEANLVRVTTVQPNFNCPSRRPSRLYPVVIFKQYRPDTGPVDFGVRTDYAMNGGDYAQWPYNLPETFEQADSPGYWSPTAMKNQTGICYQRSQVTFADVKDGTSCTFLIGEKGMDSDKYTAGTEVTDSHPAFCGFDSESVRWTGIAGGIGDSTRSNLLRQDQAGFARLGYQLLWFGSAHASGLNMSFCDGSVRTVSYGVDRETYRRLGNRKDGAVNSGSQF